MKPEVSIVIPCYNNSQHIEECINSAVNQTYPDKEIILVDDGSDSQTKEVLKHFEDKVNRFIVQENKGASAARNTGIRVATGKYIVNLDSDDYFEPEFCAKAVEFLENDQEIKVVSCYSRWFSETQEIVFKPRGGGLKNYLLKDCAMASAMFRKADALEAGLYDEKMKKGFEDWEFYIRMHGNGGFTYIIPEVLFNYRKLEQSNTTIALENKYENLRYIYAKHTDLYKDHFEVFVDFLLNKLEITEKVRDNRSKSLDYRIGKSILSPFRFLKSFAYE